MPRQVSVPGRRGLLRGAGPRGGLAGRRRGHEPRPARHRRHHRDRDPPRTRRRGHRRGARTGRPRHERRHRGVGGVDDQCRGAALREARRGAGRRPPRGCGRGLGRAPRGVAAGTVGGVAARRGPALAAVRDAAWSLRTAIGPSRPGMALSDPEAAAARNTALASVEEVHDSAVRVLSAFDEPDPAKRHDVVWLAADDNRGSIRRVVRMAPLSVGGLLRSRLFAESTVVLTSATLTVGGSFDGLAVNWGLPAESSVVIDPAMATGSEAPSDSGTLKWNALDVGSPFDHARAGIIYIAKQLPPPGRDGLSPTYLDEIAELVEAAGGRTLGLFSSMRAAKAASEAMRDRLDTPILCQGDDSTGALVRAFAGDEPTSLFGTLSLWQGVDVPGPSLSLVILDRIPFPRPDDPLLVARQKAVESRGGNGFLSVAANHAALLLAQGVGRLLRSVDDKGVVAVLDPRLATARYAGYLRASLPPFWETSDPEVVRKALGRIRDSRP
ncbi:ATP-dependent helicase [Rhodococcus opacus PD630]|nr:ATP-dependent helicase [Rhodococcus opacus PD630]